jgi:hypothetical protein
MSTTRVHPVLTPIANHKYAAPMHSASALLNTAVIEWTTDDVPAADNGRHGHGGTSQPLTQNVPLSLKTASSAIAAQQLPTHPPNPFAPSQHAMQHILSITIAAASPQPCCNSSTAMLSKLHALCHRTQNHTRLQLQPTSVLTCTGKLTHTHTS